MASSTLAAYFARIGWNGAAPPTLETLARLLRAHMTSIPFENLDVLLGRPVRLDLESLKAKVIDSRRGGYCFEHTTLFAAMLEALGFDLSRHSARVVRFLPRERAPRSHMFLTVNLAEGVFVADPGFGGPAATFPVPLADKAGDATHWMARDGDLWVFRGKGEDGAAMDAWVSTLERDLPVDFEVSNHYMSTHPNSPFTKNLMASLFTESGRVAVMNRDVSIREGEEAQKSQLDDRAALRRLLNAHLGFDLPEAEGLKIPAVPEWA